MDVHTTIARCAGDADTPDDVTAWARSGSEPTTSSERDSFYKFFEAPIGWSASIAQAQVAALQDTRA